MRFKGVKLCIAWTLFLPLPLLAKTKVNPPPVEQLSLSIKPLACIVANAGQPCQMTITANWQSPLPLTACLYQDKLQLACWQNTSSVSRRFNISLTSDMVFKLLDETGNTLASQKIKVNAANSTKYRRRLRSQWSLF